MATKLGSWAKRHAGREGLTTKKFAGGGEGSRGGKVIGHTKSGKPIYDVSGHSWGPKAHGAHMAKHAKDFSAQDHKDAATAALKERSKLKREAGGGYSDKQLSLRMLASAHKRLSKGKSIV